MNLSFKTKLEFPWRNRQSSLNFTYVSKNTQLSLNILTIKSFDRGNIGKKKLKKNASLYLYSFKRYQNFLSKIEILGFYFKSPQNRARMLKNHKIKYLGVLKHAESEKHNENLPKYQIWILKIVRNILLNYLMFSFVCLWVLQKRLYHGDNIFGYNC